MLQPQATDPVIKIVGLTKQYRLGQKIKYDTLAEKLSRTFRKSSSVQDTATNSKIINALKDFNLEIYAGEVLGIIGFNGSGKSTLLKVISRITPPTSGEIYIRGRVSSLLDIGLGFHPDLTGRENIYLNGAILGLQRREIKEKFDDIVNFADIHKFLDTPVKHYSHGMYVRLAFAIAAHLESDILLIDEVLAVGDYEFQRKCLNKIDSITKSQRTVLFVSHNLAAIENLCQRTIVIHKGEKAFDGKTADAIKFYYGLNEQQVKSTNLLVKTIIRSGTGKAKFKRIQILNHDLQPKDEIYPGDNFTIKIDLDVWQQIVDPKIAIYVKNRLGQTLFRLYNLDTKIASRTIDKKNSIYCHVKNIPLLPDSYYLTLWLADRDQTCDLIDHAYELRILKKDLYDTGRRPDTRYAGNVYVDQMWELK
jgi:lipopolysaccharide transport system ATP-binding protein